MSAVRASKHHQSMGTGFLGLIICIAVLQSLGGRKVGYLEADTETDTRTPGLVFLGFVVFYYNYIP